MRNKDTIILESLYTQIYNEMAYGMGAGGTPMSTQQIMDLIVHKNQTQGNREIPFSYTSITTPKEYKTGERKSPYAVIYKIKQTVASLNDYEISVNRELEKNGEEADFQAQSRKAIKIRLSRNIGISTKDNPLLLLNLSYVKATTTLYVAREHNGEIHLITKEQARNHLYPPPTPSSNNTSNNTRNYRIDGMVGLKIDKQEITNTDTPEDKIEVLNLVRDQLKS
jgi:hypothetical protein